MKWTLPALCLLLSVFIFSCSKDVTELPPETQTGANTFGSRVNDAFWVPAGFGVVPTAPLIEARYVDKSIFINARNFSSSPIETEFEFFIANVTAPGIYPLNKATNIYPGQSQSYAYYVKRKLTPIDEWITNEKVGGQVNITKFDLENRIVSGTFQFSAESRYTPGQTITVTDGRFDVKFQ